MIGVLGVWLSNSLGGFAWDGTSKEFNLHPLLMVCGLVFLYGECKLFIFYVSFIHFNYLYKKLFYLCTGSMLYSYLFFINSEDLKKHTDTNELSFI